MSLGQSSAPAAKSALQIERLIEERIRSGNVAVGARMPTVRALAQQWHVDKNTVARAYKSLERKGYLELTRGRGAFVRRLTPPHGDFDGRWLQRLEQLLGDAKAHALERDRVLRGVTQVLDRVYGRAGLRLALVECNRRDLENLSDVLSGAIELPFDGILLGHFLEKPVETSMRYDLIVTTFNHLAEVSAALGPGEERKVVGVQSMPTHDALLKIARLHAGVIGFVYERPRAGDEFAHAIRAYRPDATVIAVPINDEPRLRLLFQKADAIVVTQICQERLMALAPPAPVIVMTITIDRQSIDFLHSKVAALQAIPVPARL
jgi:GntR family transcriptional regulator